MPDRPSMARVDAVPGEHREARTIREDRIRHAGGVDLNAPVHLSGAVTTKACPRRAAICSPTARLSSSRKAAHR